ncbi:pyridoxal-5'-phosphate-dependent protein subunit beta, partial [Streptomyces varsoviensis]
MTSPPLHCLRCGVLVTGFTGCPECAAEGLGVNAAPPLADLSGLSLERYPGGPWGWPGALPVSAGPVTLGEGGTPNVRIPLADAGAGELWVKTEGANPTGSHKDRAMSVGVAAALDAGADTVVAASSGNAGTA